MKLACGCKMWTEDKIFYIKPCSLDCEYYKYAVDESKKHGNKIIEQNVRCN